MLWIWIMISIIFILLIGMYFQSYRYRINFQSIYFKQLPLVFDGIRILFISDVHRRKITKRLIKQIQGIAPFDYVFIGGDLVEEGVPLERVKDNLQHLTSFGATFFVWGNHDLKYDIDQLTITLHDTDVHILENRPTLLRKENNEKLWLIGVGDVCSKNDHLELALKNINDEDGFRILLSHVPTITNKIKQEQKIALVLSGHTHGGQIALPWIGAITGSVGKLFPKQVVGFHDLGYTKLFISSGYGTSHFPLRLFTTPEVVIVTMKRE